MEQFYTLFCSIALFNLDSSVLIVINSSTIKIFATVEELSRTPENTQGQENIFQEPRT